MSARGMMMATGCIQAQKCHTNHCPVGVATQDARLMRALDVEDKAKRVHNYQKLTVREAVQIMASMGVEAPSQLNARMLRRRVDHPQHPLLRLDLQLAAGGRAARAAPRGWAADWAEADADHFGEHAPLGFLDEDGPHWNDEMATQTGMMVTVGAGSSLASSGGSHAPGGPSGERHPEAHTASGTRSGEQEQAKAAGAQRRRRADRPTGSQPHADHRVHAGRRRQHPTGGAPSRVRQNSE